MPIGTPLTGAQLYQLFSRLVTNGQSDTSIDQFTFFNLLNIVKNEIEMEREWNLLKGIDKTQVWNVGDTFDGSPKALPADFNFWQSEDQIALVQSSNPETYIYLAEITGQKQLEYQEYTDRFWADYYNSKFYITGNATMQYQIWQFYIKSSPDFTIANIPNALTQTWVFPGTAHPLLAMYAAAMYKTGLDYDAINARQATDNYKTVEAIKRWLGKWDGRLQAGALRGVDRGRRSGQPFISGHVDMFADQDTDY